MRVANNFCMNSLTAKQQTKAVRVFFWIYLKYTSNNAGIDECDIFANYTVQVKPVLTVLSNARPGWAKSMAKPSRI